MVESVAVDLHPLLECRIMMFEVEEIDVFEQCSISISIGNGGHLMGTLPTTTAGYNPMVGASAASPYGHPYNTSHHGAPQMHGLPSPGHGGAHMMHGVHHQQHPHNLSMHPNAPMMSAANSPVLLVSNLNEDVSSKARIDRQKCYSRQY